MVTWFQFHSYLQRQSVSDLEKHLIQLTKEGRVRSWQWPGSKLQPTLGTLSFWLGHKPDARSSPSAVKAESGR